MRATILSLSFSLSSMAVAQLPADGILVLEATAAFYVPNYQFVDALGRGATTVSGQNVWMLPSPASVAVDPIDPRYFYFQANPSSLMGTWRSQVGLLANIEQSMWGPWLQTSADRVEAGSTQVFTLRAGVVEACQRLPAGLGQATPLFQLVGAVDLAVTGSLLYVASDAVGVAAPVIEYDLSTGNQRLVDNYVGVRAIAASPFGPELCLGFATGEVRRVDAATGATISTLSTGLGPIVAVGYTRLGTLVYADAQQLWSELVTAGPLFVSATSIRDFGVTTRVVAAVTPFGSGCGVGQQVRWSTTSQPTLGNAGFALGMSNGPISSIALLMLGSSRTFSTMLGVPLPFDLQSLGAAGCLLLVDPVVPLLQLTTASGQANQGIPIPNSPALAGVEFSGQWFVLDATVGSLGLAGSEGVAVVTL